MPIAKDKKVQVTSVIPIEHKQLLERIASEEGRSSLSAQIAYVIKLYLTKKPVPNDRMNEWVQCFQGDLMN
jgi:hypothetical protein